MRNGQRHKEAEQTRLGNHRVFESKTSAPNFTKVMFHEKGPRKTEASGGPPITSEPVRRIGLGPPFRRDPGGDSTDYQRRDAARALGQVPK